MPADPRRLLGSLPPTLLVYVGLAVSLLGILPVLATLGLMGDGPEGPLGVVVALLFGVVFGGAGGTLVHLGLATALRQRFGSARPFVTGILRLLVLRVTRRSLAAAAPDLVLGVLMLGALAWPALRSWLGGDELSQLAVLEFFALHSTAFLGLLAFVRWRGSWFALQALLFAAVLGLYAFAAQQATGIVGAVWFGGLTAAKYVGYAMTPPALARKAALALRWFTNLILFMALAGLFDLDLEAGDDLGFVATYFLVLALFEAFDLMAPVGRGPQVASRAPDARG